MKEKVLKFNIPKNKIKEQNIEITFSEYSFDHLCKLVGSKNEDMILLQGRKYFHPNSKGVLFDALLNHSDTEKAYIVRRKCKIENCLKEEDHKSKCRKKMQTNSNFFEAEQQTEEEEKESDEEEMEEEEEQENQVNNEVLVEQIQNLTK